ncbi:MAG: DUF3857 domain-containing protein [Terrimonas sp.]|nr:DUF3857 domain-containing protein [Terrimonas sp.]
MRKLLFFAAAIFLITDLSAQDYSDVKFGKIDKEDFNKKVYSIDSNASAVILFDKAYTYFEGNSKGWFSYVTKRHKRVHILNKNGYDAANHEVYLYSGDGDEEELQGLKAVTYNLENGKIVQTKLDSKSVFKDKLDKNLEVKKFTMPNVKEGSIIEYTYTKRSDFLTNLDAWAFQGQYPELYTEYELQLPLFFNYVFISQGYLKLSKTEKRSSGIFTVNVGSNLRNDFQQINSEISSTKWFARNVPALKAENFTSTLSNHIAKIEFQLSEYRDPLAYRQIMQTWPQLTKGLLESESFGDQLDKANGWMNDDIKDVTLGITGDAAKARKIYEFVRDNFTCTDHSALYMDKPLKNVLKDKKGSVAELNLLLTGMLKNAGLTADPVILSTKSHGFINSLYPIRSKFNYVICRVILDGQPVYLDASYGDLGFGKLYPNCYNGQARVVNADATAVNLFSDQLMESKLTSVFIVNGDDGNLVGSFKQTPGYYESNSIREKVQEKGKDEFFRDIQKSYTIPLEIKDDGIDSLKKYDQPVQMHYDFTIEENGDDIIYFNPMLGEAYKENPFKSAQRLYPVEMPYAMDETYLLHLDIPTGYVLDELPKSTKVLYDEKGNSFFEYILSESNGSISMRARIRLTRSFYAPEEYEYLREFFNLVVKKQSEQIVFKKKA